MTTNRIPLRAAFSARRAVLWPAIILALLGCRDDATERQLTAWRAIETSGQLGAQYEVPALWDSARTCYDIAVQLTERENDRLFAWRDYAAADSHFALAYELATRAADKTGERKRAKFSELQARISRATQRLDSLRATTHQHLMRISLRHTMAAAELHLASAAKIASESTWAETNIELDSADNAMATVERALFDHASASASESDRWRQWVDETMLWSRRTDSAALIVLKRRHRAYLITHGRVMDDFAVELGYGSAGDKRFAGDAATPEGVYQITRRRETGSRYYKALDLDYPNREDRKRFEAARKNGSIPLGVRIGGNIEIHGHGGRGGDWTNGCIAMTDEDIDRLMKNLTAGSRVTIVRSLDGWPE